MLKMSISCSNARVQTFAKVVDSIVDRCLWHWQVIPDDITSTVSDVLCSVSKLRS